MSHAAIAIPGLDRIGGAERQAMLLAKGLRRRGWRVSVVALSGSGAAAAVELRDCGVAFLIAVGSNERVDHSGRQRRVARAEAYFDQHGARQRLDVQAAREAIKQPGLSLGCGFVGTEARKAAGKVAAEAGSFVELKRDDHAPGKPVAAQNAGQGFQCDGRGKDGGGNLSLSAIQAERGDRRGAELDAANRFVLIGRDEAIENARDEKRPQDGGNEATAPSHHPPKVTQRGRRGPNCVRRIRSGRVVQ